MTQPTPSSTIVEIRTTFSARAAAEACAARLVRDRLAACVQLSDIRSFFLWEGTTQKESEVALYIKTTEACYSDLEAYILEHHSYDVPEIIKLPVTGGLPAYLNWLDSTTASPKA